MRYVAISTVPKYYLLTNYGSFFQHYSLRLILRRMGFMPFRVAVEGESHSLLWRLEKRMKDFLRPIYWRFKHDENSKQNIVSLQDKTEGEKAFVRCYCELIGALDETPKSSGSTIGIRGGDQVLYECPDSQWLPKVQNSNPVIAYAASTDWEEFSKNTNRRNFIKEKLSRFTAIGIRESTGVAAIKELLPKDVPVQHVADPVQLLKKEDFKQIQATGEIFTRPTIFCYLVNIRSSDDLCLSEYERLAEMLGCELRFVGIQGGEIFIPRNYRSIYSPRQFLRALDDCKYFITNSYHGSVLAMQYQKNFLSVWQNSLPGTNQNERQSELMHKFGVEDHWVDYKLPAEEWHRIITTSIDWARVNAEAEEWRAASLEWLQKAIGMGSDL